MKMSKKTIEQLEFFEKLSKEIREDIEKKENHYHSTGFRKELNILNIACARANKEIIENKEWDKYGSHTSGYEVAIEDLPAVLASLQQIIKEINVTGKQTKLVYSDTAKGDTTYDRSAVGVWISPRFGEPYRDTAQRMSY